MDDKTLLSIGGSILAVVGMVFSFSRANSAKFKDVHNKIEKVKDDYVRRDDLDKRLEHIEKGQVDLNAKVDRLLDRK